MNTTTRKLPSTWKRHVRATLRIEKGPDKGLETVLDLLDSTRSGPFRCGRSVVNDLRLTDEAVSDPHFELVIDPGGGVRLRDLNSTNGISIGNVRVFDALLRPGTAFQVGKSVIRFTSSDQDLVLISSGSSFGDAYGRSLVMRELFAKLEQIAGLHARLSVLITGETGTGKELVARALHTYSDRADGPFIAVNCAAIPRELAESVLFGHQKGSFTGAVGHREGLFEAASGGTLFLDEIGELPAEIQPKLLRALETKKVTRIGLSAERSVDVRVISATHRDLRKMVSQNKFGGDLYFRLAKMPVALPPLRERSDDVLFLSRLFLQRHAKEGGYKSLTRDAEEHLMRHSWPGNVRELDDVIERSYWLARGDVLDVVDLHMFREIDDGGLDRVPGQVFDQPLEAARHAFERAYLERIMAGPGRLSDKAKRAGLSVEGFRLLRKRHQSPAVELEGAPE